MALDNLFSKVTLSEMNEIFSTHVSFLRHCRNYNRLEDLHRGTDFSPTVLFAVDTEFCTLNFEF